ncbi:hypothetical protein LEP1GSC202_0332 [Leptospira yanagawae serovar Saopaulo str. Sao Paulo = ATCC 700523]|uniref:Uncharacterized protein n=1 Tax=Leptospira yanagawae serovar Saopaulo str. Sao Paulo = ATCC 700523 TaxID=1249483 RepID=A0A5E8H9L5_9LEPT|nr:hypothetical protein [Leptospira yanagawae]EOQ87408.1 hypothetical protein LEP1GSC202_0332 [Leptospira yanagawae serovar Saopaulo str. Sao Paulo = ATCC 700523]
MTFRIFITKIIVFSLISCSSFWEDVGIKESNSSADNILLLSLLTASNNPIKSEISARVRLASEQVITNNTETDIQFTTVDYDNTNLWNSISGFKIKTSGKYLVVLNAAFQSNTTGNRYYHIGCNCSGSATPLATAAYSNAQNDFDSSASISAIRSFQVNDVIYSNVRQTSGSNLNLRANITTLSIFKLD